MDRLQIVCDFDGIMSGEMLFNESGKFAKQMQYGVRHAIDMLNWFDCDVHVISGDSTEAGQRLIKTMLGNCNIKSLMLCNYKTKLQQLVQTFDDLSSIVYIADDLHDIAIAECVGNFVTTCSAIEPLQQRAAYVSKSAKLDYAYMDIACEIVKTVLHSSPMLYVQHQLNTMLSDTRLKALGVNEIYIVGTSKDEDNEVYLKWFDDTFGHIFGKTVEQLRESGVLVDYVQASVIANPIDSKKTLFIVHPEILATDYKRFKYMHKLYIDFTQCDIDDIVEFMQHMKSEFDDKTSREALQCQLCFGFFGTERRAALLTNDDIAGNAKAYIDGISSLDNDEALAIKEQSASYCCSIFDRTDCKRDTVVVR